MTPSDLSWVLRKVPPHLRDDARQEALLAAWRAERRYDSDRSSPSTFAKRCATGAVLDFLRQEDPLSRVERKRVKDGLREDIHFVEISPEERDLQASPARTVAAIEAQRLLAHATPREHYVLRMIFIFGMTLREAGRQIGVSQGRAFQIRNAGLQRIREKVLPREQKEVTRT